MADLLSVFKGESMSFTISLRGYVDGMFFTPTPLAVLMQAEQEPPHAA